MMHLPLAQLSQLCHLNFCIKEERVRKHTARTVVLLDQAFEERLLLRGLLLQLRPEDWIIGAANSSMRSLFFAVLADAAGKPEADPAESPTQTAEASHLQDGAAEAQDSQQPCEQHHHHEASSIP